MRVTARLSAREWSCALERLPKRARDVYFTPEYHALEATRGGTRAHASLVEDGSAALLVVGLETPIAEGLWDLQTCNGYGGPIASTDAGPGFLEVAWRACLEQLRADGMVAAFFRLQPLLGNQALLPAGATLVLDRQTVVVPLRGDEEEVLKAADGRHRNMVNRSRRESIEIRWEHDSSGWRDFALLYGEAMERLRAGERLRFPAHYFEQLAALPCSEIACIRTGGRLVAAAVFLWGEVFGHYFLAARSSGAPNFAANALVQAGVDRGRAKGLEVLHLGGGATSAPNDSLFRFKATVSPTRVDFRVALVVADPGRFKALNEAWERANQRAPSWLLGYRQPVIRSES